MTRLVSTTWTCDRCAIDIVQTQANFPAPHGWVGLAVNPNPDARLIHDGWEQRHICGDCFMALLGFLSGALVEESDPFAAPPTFTIQWDASGFKEET